MLARAVLIPSFSDLWSWIPERMASAELKIGQKDFLLFEFVQCLTGLVAPPICRSLQHWIAWQCERGEEECDFELTCAVLS